MNRMLRTALIANATATAAIAVTVVTAWQELYALRQRIAEPPGWRLLAEPPLRSLD